MVVPLLLRVNGYESQNYIGSWMVLSLVANRFDSMSFSLLCNRQVKQLNSFMYSCLPCMTLFMKYEYTQLCNRSTSVYCIYFYFFPFFKSLWFQVIYCLTNIKINKTKKIIFRDFLFAKFCCDLIYKTRIK